MARILAAIILGIALGFAAAHMLVLQWFTLVPWGVAGILLGIGAAPVNQAYHYLAGNRAALPGAICTMIVAAGFGEEVVFRGFLYQRLRTLFGHGPAASAIIITITAAVFGLAHYFDQGIPGVEQAVITGIVFGTMFVIAGQIWIVMFAHAAFDLTAVAMIYLNVESRIGHSVFR